MDRDQYDDMKRLGVGFASTKALLDDGPAAVVDRLVRPGRDLYVSIDIDVLDPGFAPGTGTPEAGGLTSRELLALVRGFENTRLIGADVVEVSPPYDHAEITSLAAATLGYEITSLMARATS